MTKSRSQELSEKAAAERRRCRDWLLPFMQNGQPKFLTKDELRAAAMRQLNVSKSSFYFAWIDAIETTGRHDWYEPLRRRRLAKTEPLPYPRPPNRVRQRLAGMGDAEQCRLLDPVRTSLPQQYPLDLCSL
jgi:hypothetical protein